MTVFARIGVLVAIASTLVSVVSASAIESRTGGGGGYGGGGYGGHPGGGNQGGGSDCGKSEFWFSRGGKQCCTPHGGVPNAPKPPKDHQCPKNGYYWNEHQGCCVPNHEPPANEQPDCPSDCKWNHDGQYCQPQSPPSKPSSSAPSKPTPSKPSGHDGDCGKDEFWFSRGNKKCCTPHGGVPNPPKPPKDHQCPKGGYYWHEGQGCCVPDHQPPPNDEPDCPSDCKWNHNDQYCQPQGPKPSSSVPSKPSSSAPSKPSSSAPSKPSSSTPSKPTPTKPSGHDDDCDEGDWWFSRGGKKCCTPHGGVPNPPKPPQGHECPKDGYYWHKGQGCCVPNHRPPPNDEPHCPSNCHWNHDDQYCQPHGPPPPQPSGHYGGHHGKGGKRNHKSRATSLCPSGLSACPIKGLTPGEYECLDTTAELESCGGCTSLGQGEDCTAIHGAWNVGCEKGSCAVYTCASGFTLSLDRKSCIAL